MIEGSDLEHKFQAVSHYTRTRPASPSGWRSQCRDGGRPRVALRRRHHARHGIHQRGHLKSGCDRVVSPRACVLSLLSALLALLSSGGLAPGFAGNDWTASSASMTPAPAYRLVPDRVPEHESWMTGADLGTDTALGLRLAPEAPPQASLTAAASSRATARVSWRPPYSTLPPVWAEARDRDTLFAGLAMSASQVEQLETEVPRWEFLERHRLSLSILIPITTLGAVTGDALLPYGRDKFQVDHEGWFGPNTSHGGADKASHLADYFVITGLFEDVYRMIGYTEKDAILWAFGLAVATGLAVEVNNGFTKEYGFSWEDLTMDVAGAIAASVVSLTRTRDLFGLRTSHLPGSTYTHDVYSADLKLAGLARRLGINIGPLRWLLFSVTYGSKGYHVSPPITQQRQLGFEVGLNLQQILDDLGVRRNTWWGYSLHLIGDNVRFPFTAVGMRLDLNRGNWHGPNSGNYD